MVLTKFFVAIILTKLQRFESRASVEKTNELGGFGKILRFLRVKFNADFVYAVSFYHKGLRSPLQTGDSQTHGICSTFKAL